MSKWSLVLLLFSLEALAKIDTRINWYNRTIYQDPQRSFANPNNTVLNLHHWEAETDLRPSLSWSKDSHVLKFDPRFIGRTHTKGDLFVNEAYYQLSLDDHQFTLGLQNYQWGPAEMLNSTNPIFRFLLDQRSLYFQQRGRNLVRWNWSLSRHLTLVTMIEVSKNGDDLPKEDQEFSPNGIVKLESVLDKASDYVGLVIGKTPYQEEFIGEYGALYLSDEASFYFDVRHQENTNSFFPGQNSSEQFSEQNAEKKIYTIGTIGLRHESRVDVRLEYIYNEIGFTESKWNKAKASLRTLGPNLSENFKRYYFSGRDLNKQHYAYLSVRVPDLGKKNQYTLFFRHFNSLQDQSSLTQFQMDRLTGESFNLYAEASTYQGRSDEDFSSLLRSEFSLGFRWSY